MPSVTSQHWEDLAAGQLLTAYLFAVVERAGRKEPVVQFLEQRSSRGLGSAADQLELLVHASQSVQGLPTPLDGDLPDHDVFRYVAAGPMLHALLVGAVEEQDLAPLVDGFQSKAAADADGNGPLFTHALRLLGNARAMAAASRRIAGRMPE